MEKFNKNKSYTYDEIKKIINDGIEKTILNPNGKAGDELKKDRKIKEDSMSNFMASLHFITTSHTLKENIFEEEEDK